MANQLAGLGRGALSAIWGVGGLDKPLSWIGERVGDMVGRRFGILLRRRGCLRGAHFLGCCTYARTSPSSFKDTLWTCLLVAGGSAGRETLLSGCLGMCSVDGDTSAEKLMDCALSGTVGRIWFLLTGEDTVASPPLEISLERNLLTTKVDSL